MKKVYEVVERVMFEENVWTKTTEIFDNRDNAWKYLKHYAKKEGWICRKRPTLKPDGSAIIQQPYYADSVEFFIRERRLY